MSDLALLLNSNRCSKGMFKCITGECRYSPSDCPSQITCPNDFPI
jgi:hypothetical protein